MTPPKAAAPSRIEPVPVPPQLGLDFPVTHVRERAPGSESAPARGSTPGPVAGSAAGTSGEASQPTTGATTALAIATNKRATEAAQALARLQASGVAFLSAFQQLQDAWESLGAMQWPSAEAGAMSSWSIRHRPGGQQLPELPRRELVALQRSAESWRHALRDAGQYADEPWSDAMRATGFAVIEHLFWLQDAEAWHPEGRGVTADGLRARLASTESRTGTEGSIEGVRTGFPQSLGTWPMRYIHRLAEYIALPILWEDAGRYLVEPLVHTRADVRWWITHRGRNGSLTTNEVSWLLARPDVGPAEWTMLLCRTGPASPALDTMRDVLHRISSPPSATKPARTPSASPLPPTPPHPPLVLRAADGVAWWSEHLLSVLTTHRALPDGQEFWLQGTERLLPWLPSDVRSALWGPFSQRAPERTLRVLARADWPCPLSLDDVRQLLRTPVRSVREAAMRSLHQVEAVAPASISALTPSR